MSKRKRLERRKQARQRHEASGGFVATQKSLLLNKHQTEALAVLTRRKQELKHPRDTVIGVFQGDRLQITASTKPSVRIAVCVYKELAKKAFAQKSRDAGLCLILTLFDKSKVLDEFSESIVNIIRNLALNHEAWVRDPSTWKCPTRNRKRALSSLIAHVVAKWPMPAFMDWAWGGERRNPHIQWYLHMSRGNNLRTLSGLPIPFTKKLAHEFLRTPPKEVESIGQALTWAYCVRQGATTPMLRGIIRCPMSDMARPHPDNEFWLSVWRWLIEQPMLNPAQFGPITDYILNRKFVPRRQDDGSMRPDQPGFSMQRRDPMALLREVNRWHSDLQRIRVAEGATWKPSGIGLLKEEESAEEFAAHPYDAVANKERGYWSMLSGNKDNPTRWEMVELLSSGELAVEGRAHKHCVVSYAYSCKQGIASIWSLRRSGKVHEERVQTIEVYAPGKRVVQSRGKFNALPDAKIANIVRTWAKECGLTIGKNVLP